MRSVWYWYTFRWMDHMTIPASNELKQWKREYWLGVPLWRFKPLVGYRVINDPTVDQIPKLCLKAINR